jgi:hypothetical protein
MSLGRELSGAELVVAEDGSIPAEHLQALGLQPGAHLRVLDTGPPSESDSAAGSLPDFPDLSWEDFEIASAAAIQDSTAR